ncbi:MAG: tRNA lysidine(34) synthetase TilS [Lachnospiraceae bacterium]|nr:tRNA lysidine(34) synthetase TilS [Lachnospiraceae bacterium]
MGIPGFCYQVYQEVNRKGLIREGDRIILALSGGADSVCLFLCLFYMQKLLPFSLLAFHVIHGIRGEEAEEDAAFAKDLAGRFGIPFRLARVDAPAYAKEEGLSLEEAARILRYRELMKEAEKEEARIAVAHHMEDQAETVLLQLVRGSSLKGLSGMQSERGRLIRPLLPFHKEEILSFLAEQKQPYRTDSTNLDLSYARNAVRHKVLPELCRVNAKTTGHIARVAEEMDRTERFLEELTKEAFEKAVFYKEDLLMLRIAEMKKLPELLKSRVVYKALCETARRKKDLSDAHVTAVLHLFEAEGGKRVALPCHMTAERRGKCVLIKREY